MPSHTTSKMNGSSADQVRMWRWIAAGAGTVVLASVAIGWFLWSRYEDPDVARVRELSAQLFSSDSELTFEDRGRLFGELREARENLTENQQEQLRTEMGNVFRARMSQQIDAYFELPEEERVAYLDRQIQQMEQGRRAFEQRSNANGGAGGRGGPPGGWGNTGGGRGPWGGNRGGDNEVSRRRQMLDNTTPEQRAKWGQYMSDMTKRREQLGLTPLPFPPRR